MELKAHGWALCEIESMTLADLHDALQWVQNKQAQQNQFMLAGFQYHLMAQNKKSSGDAKALAKKITKITDLNPKNRPTVLSALMALKAKSGI